MDGCNNKRKQFLQNSACNWPTKWAYIIIREGLDMAFLGWWQQRDPSKGFCCLPTFGDHYSLLQKNGKPLQWWWRVLSRKWTRNLKISRLKRKSSSKPSFLGSMLILGGVRDIGRGLPKKPSDSGEACDTLLNLKLNHDFILLMAEILRSPVELGSLSHYLLRVLYIPGGCLGFQPSTVLFPGVGFKHLFLGVWRFPIWLAHIFFRWVETSTTPKI